MAASIEDANSLILTITSLQPRVVKAGEDDSNDPLATQCAALLEQIPDLFDIRSIKERVDVRSDPDPLKTVLYQELDRYNRLLATIRRTLSSIIKVTQGTVSVTAELEDVMLALSNRQVPRIWGSTYPSLKPLGSWIKDLIQRVDFFSSWAEDRLPNAWWLPAMTYPAGFLTAVLQVSARMNGVSIDSLSYETTVLTSSDRSTITAAPKDGVYVYGIFIEGSTWNFPGGFLEESRPMELISPMPIIHFKPIEGKRRAARGFYACPLYLYPIRSGTRERPSYVVTVDLKSGKFTADFWTKRGVAMLLSTSF
jgi:dynein heavy chain, axonemal